MKGDTINFATGIAILSDDTGAGGTILLILREYSIFLKASESSILGLSIKQFD